jgi:hypothetical protein
MVARQEEGKARQGREGPKAEAAVPSSESASLMESTAKCGRTTPHPSENKKCFLRNNFSSKVSTPPLQNC